MSKESDKIAGALENMSITFDELGFSPTIPIPKGDKTHFIDWFKFEIDEIKAVSTQQDQRIAELEEQLKNAIVPKFKIGQECYVLLGKEIEKITIAGCRIKISKMEDENFTMYSITDSQCYACSVLEEQLFFTKEEVQAKLKELGGKK